ncbi:mechanosensitive ion channel domain-containing protein [Desulfurococcus amylolyticus]|uniref:MscS Mechanosensitive ion channel n=1 Tax=Desulfurococcus amylolyticus DSM 16532 TaxID=768672 RepID=I3XR97_DESAM|nr:mechanosensitive ion channel domain-containing protein [Desulfurococcus amylolyticus]AFL66471.1 MscS Mechanosensitive ion channel [Desulfurococcus amylolyticus DSM 16532]
MSEPGKDSIGSALARVVLYAVIVAIVMGILQWFFTQGVDLLVKTTKLEGLQVLKDYATYIYIIVLLVLGWMIVNSVAQLFYTMLKPRYGASSAAAMRSLVKILGLGGLLAGIAGGVAGGAAGVALGGFIGLVIGFATQQVLGQAVAGMFILLARPFKIGDIVDIAGESGVEVKDISTMFTIVQRSDGVEVLIPSSMIIGQKIAIRKRA